MTQTLQMINRKTGKPEWVVIRQIPGVDKIYKVGSKGPKGYGLVIGKKV